MELRWGNREGPYPDRLTVHREGKPGQQEEEPLAHELRCWPNIPQVCLLGCFQRLLVLLSKDNYDCKVKFEFAFV